MFVSVQCYLSAWDLADGVQPQVFGVVKGHVPLICTPLLILSSALQMSWFLTPLFMAMEAGRREDADPEILAGHEIKQK